MLSGKKKERKLVVRRSTRKLIKCCWRHICGAQAWEVQIKQTSDGQDGSQSAKSRRHEAKKNSSKRRKMCLKIPNSASKFMANPGTRISNSHTTPTAFFIVERDS